MRAIGADWYTGNCHKWLCAPKGSAFLYAAPNRQHDLHPVTISHGLGMGFLEEFDWTGTRDPSAYLATDVAIDFHARLGGEALMARNVALAAEATSLLARRLNTEPGRYRGDGRIDGGDPAAAHRLSNRRNCRLRSVLDCWRREPMRQRMCSLTPSGCGFPPRRTTISRIMSGSATSLHAWCARYRETSAPLRPVTSLVAALMSALAPYVVDARRPDPTRRG